MLRQYVNSSLGVVLKSARLSNIHAQLNLPFSKTQMEIHGPYKKFRRVSNANEDISLCNIPLPRNGCDKQAARGDCVCRLLPALLCAGSRGACHTGCVISSLAFRGDDP